VFKETSSKSRMNIMPIYRSSWTRTMDLPRREPRAIVRLPFSNFNKRRCVIDVMVIPTCG
jgi:hypothetical protein